MQLLTVIIFSISVSIAINIMARNGEVLHFYGKFLASLPSVFAKPLGECVKCFSGQLAFWSYIFIVSKYNIVEHLTTVSISIIIGYLWQNYVK